MLSAEQIAGYTALVNYALVHKYTKEAVSDGSIDTWKMATPAYAAAVVDIACNYLSEGQLFTRDRGVVSVDSPSIMIAKTDTLKVGDRVTNIKDNVGTIVRAGPLYVEEVEVAMGFGTVTNYIATLSGSRPLKW